MNYMEIADKAIDEIRELYDSTEAGKSEALKKASMEYQTIGATIIKLTPQQVDQNKAAANSLFQEVDIERDKAVAEIANKADQKLKDYRKAAFQRVAEAEPIPTEKDRDRAAELRIKYGFTDGAMPKEINFLNDMREHVENETVLAFPYLMVAREEFADRKNLQQEFIDLEKRIFPQIGAALDDLAAVDAAINSMNAGFILYKFRARGSEMTTLERIELKQQLAATGAIKDYSQHPELF